MPSASLESISLGITFAILLVLMAIYNIFFKGKQSSSLSSSSSGTSLKKGKESKEEIVRRKIDSAPNGPLHLFFGSQTGTAEGFAKQIYQEGKKKGFGCKVVDLDEFNPEELRYSKRAIFLMATYGEGDPTDNAIDFMKWIKNEEEELKVGEELSGLQYMVFGLGSTQYEHFNRTSKLTDKYIESLGGERIMDLCLGDDNQSLDDDFDAWREQMWEVLTKMSKKNGGGDVEKDHHKQQQLIDLPSLNYTIQFVNEGGNGFEKKNNNSIPKKRVYKESEINSSTKFFFPSHSHDIFTSVNKELRDISKDDGSTKHIEYDLSRSPQVQYTTADNLAILPENDAEKVKVLADSLGYNLSSTFILKNCEKHFIPTPATIGEVLTRYYDISGIPRRQTLKLLSLFAKDAIEQDRLRFLASKEGKADFRSFIEEDCRSVFQLITESFPSIKIPFEYFLNIIPTLQPRYYTISSSSLADPKTLSITVSLTKVQTRIGKLHLGVASSYLCQQENPQAQEPIRGFIRPSSFRLPQDVNSPIIMVGPGTGIAPMRAFLHEIRHLRKTSVKTAGEVILFFGCKSRAQDYIYQDELQSFLQDGTLSELHVAFSREQKQKVYVQDFIRKQNISLQMWELLQKNASIYVCGSTTMGLDVKTAFAELVGIQGQIKDTMKYMKDLEANKRYVQELW